MIPMRGNVTDCYVHIGSDRVRMVGLAERELKSIPQPASSIEEQKSDVVIRIDSERSDHSVQSVPSYSSRRNSNEWDLMESLFAQQISGYFRIPFDNISP